MNENIVCTFIDAHFAELVLRVIDEVEYPRLMCDGEKEAVRKGLMLLLDRQPVERGKTIEKLKPCPFCGGSDIDIRTDDNGLSWYSFCNDCGVMCGYSMTKDDVMNAWNRRADKSENGV